MHLSVSQRRGNDMTAMERLQLKLTIRVDGDKRELSHRCKVLGQRLVLLSVSDMTDINSLGEIQAESISIDVLCGRLMANVAALKDLEEED